MPDPVSIELLPLGKTLSVARGTPLSDALFPLGVEFPCGGRGRCKGCRVKVLAGNLPITPADERWLPRADLESGWRLACQASVIGNLKIELAQWEAAILADDATFEFTPAEGLGIAIDVGTTTVVAQLLDLRNAQVLAVRLGVNAQAKHGADIMSRIDFALTHGQSALEQIIRRQIGAMVEELLSTAAGRETELRQIVLVGNSVMHHLFSGVSVEPLSHTPFEPEDAGLQIFTADELGWKLPGHTKIRFLPCLGSFVGSDILAGMLATGLHRSESLVGLVDLGTNGEIVVGNRDRFLCASTAAGPAFEGARISMGMRASTGAISEVHLQAGQLHCRVLGGAEPRGVCGSGLVDAVAIGLNLGWIQPTGRFARNEDMVLSPPVVLKQADIRELQLAKGAIAAGLQLLIAEWGATPAEVTRIYLAGAFGNYISRVSARRIGLLDFPPDQVVPAGNAALHGAKLALFNLGRDDGGYDEIRQRVRHLSLNEDPRFLDVFADQMRFPEAC